MHARAVDHPMAIGGDPAAFERDGFVLLRSALQPQLTERLRRAHRRIHREELRSGRTAEDGSLHLLGVLGRDRAILELTDHPRILELVTAILGWNIHIYHSHLDAHPRVPQPRRRWGWHQDGGRQNLELETDPRPRLSIKAAVFLSDARRAGCGTIEVIPGSHERNTLSRPERLDGAFDDPAGACPVSAAPGDVLLFDRRLWHARGVNVAGQMRRMVFLGYTYRWIQQREPHGLSEESLAALSPVRRQLVGALDAADGHWVPPGVELPLATWMAERQGPSAVVG
jgi:ectoine hydroxylase-related dioxygenase (phytanoyl-CoA dioxygenase family)